MPCWTSRLTSQWAPVSGTDGVTALPHDGIRIRYIALARARSTSNLRILLVHVLRPSSFSTITIHGLQIARLLGGAIILEQIFSIPGIGRLLMHAVHTRDLIVIQGCVTVFCADLCRRECPCGCDLCLAGPPQQGGCALMINPPRNPKPHQAGQLGRQMTAAHGLSHNTSARRLGAVFRLAAAGDPCAMARPCRAGRFRLDGAEGTPLARRGIVSGPIRWGAAFSAG